MTDIEFLFKNRKVDTKRLLAFGFAKVGGVYRYTTGLLDGQFEMTVSVTKEGAVAAEVIDSASGESYVLHLIDRAQGAFVGQVRAEYREVLSAAASACFETEVFKSAGARAVIRYAREQYGNQPEFLWERFPDNAIFRRQDTKKWYAALLTVQKSKLGLDGDGTVEIIDLRAKPEDVAMLVNSKTYLPGFHMNKKHWFTVCLDGAVPLADIFARIDESFVLALK